MIFKRITSFLLTTSLLSQSIFPAFAMDQIETKPSTKIFGRPSHAINVLKQVPITKPHNDKSPKAMEERRLVNVGYREYLSTHVSSGVVVQGLDWVFSDESAYVAYDILKDDPDYTFSFLPLELLEDETKESSECEKENLPIKRVKHEPRHKHSKRVIGKKDKTAAGILHYAQFQNETYVLLGERNDNKGWCNLGGGSEDGEAPHQTASRESKEESFGIYAIHPDLLKRLPYIDTIIDKNDSPFFHRLYFQSVQYLSADIFKDYLVKNKYKPHCNEYLDFMWVKASDLWEAVADGQGVLQVGDRSIQLFEPMYQTLSTHAGEEMLSKLWLDRTLTTTRSTDYFSVRESFNQCYLVGNKLNTHDTFKIQSEFYQPMPIEQTEIDKVLATAVAAHGMAMVELKRKNQVITPPTAKTLYHWNPKCEKTLSQIHLAMVLSDQYKEPEDFKGEANPRRAANLANMKTFIRQHNDEDYWLSKGVDRKIDFQESDYNVLADILEWEEEHREWPMFIHGATDGLNNLFKAFTYLRELLGVRSLQNLVATRGTDLYFKRDKKIWDMIARTGAVQNKETSNAMIFLNFVLFATRSVTRSTSSSIEYFVNNHSVIPQDNSVRFEEAMALCGFSKPDYSYYHSLFEQYYKHQHPTLENSVLVAVNQNPEGLDDYNYPTPGGGGFIDDHDKKMQSTAHFVHGIQNELKLQRQREQKLQWEFEHPVDYEDVREHKTFKPKARSGRVRFEAFSNDTERKKELFRENRRFLEAEGYLNLDLVRATAFDRFPPTDSQKKSYDAEMRKATVHIIAEWLAEHTQGIPGSFNETPVIKKIYAMAYEKLMSEKPEESLSLNGFRYLVQNSTQENVQQFIINCMDIFDSKQEPLPRPMVLNFLSALLAYGNLDLFKIIFDQNPKIDLNENFPNIHYVRSTQQSTVPIIHMLTENTPNFSETIQYLIEKGVNRILWILDNKLVYKLLDELTFYANKLTGQLQHWFVSYIETLQMSVGTMSAELLNLRFPSLISVVFNDVEGIRIESYVTQEAVNHLVESMKTNKRLKRLSVDKEGLLPIRSGRLLARGIKDSAVLEELNLPTQILFDVMSELATYDQGAFRDAPWFRRAQEEFATSVENICQAIDQRKWPLLTKLLQESKLLQLDFSRVRISDFNQWISALVAGLRDNPILCTLILPEEWHIQDIMIALITKPDGIFKQAPWFSRAWVDMLANPKEFLAQAASDKNDHAILTILKNAPKEINLRDCILNYRGWISTLAEELSQDMPYRWLNLSKLWIEDTTLIKLCEALKTNTKLRSLNLEGVKIIGNSSPCLGEALKKNATLETLILDEEKLTDVMAFLCQEMDGPFKQAPWFKQTWQEMIGSPERYIKLANNGKTFDKLKHIDFMRQIVIETSVESLDLTTTSYYGEFWQYYNWIVPVSEGLHANTSIQTLKLNLDDFKSVMDMECMTSALLANNSITCLELKGKVKKKHSEMLESLNANINLEVKHIE